jgi:hypothetical protein
MKSIVDNKPSFYYPHGIHDDNDQRNYNISNAF